MTVRYELYVRIGERRYRLADRGEATDLREARDIIEDRLPHMLPLHAWACGFVYNDWTQPLRATRAARAPGAKHRGLAWTGI